MKSFKSLNIFFCLFLLATFVLKGQKVDPHMTDLVVPPEKLANLVAGITPKGWELYDKVLEFTPENLYEQINGRAEYYIAYNMINMIYASFNKCTANGTAFNLFIYDMGTPTNAFGAFSGERSFGAPQFNLGREAYRSGADCYIWHGQYYYQITANDTTNELKQVIIDLAGILIDSLQDSGQPVWGLNVLPKKDLVPQSVQYFLNDALGYEFLHNTYTAKYYKNEEIVSILLSQHDSPESVQSTIIKFKEHVNKYGKGVDLLTVDSTELICCDMGGHYDIVFHKGRLFAGVIGIKDKKMGIEATIDFRNQLQTE